MNRRTLLLVVTAASLFLAVALAKREFRGEPRRAEAAIDASGRGAGSLRIVGCARGHLWMSATAPLDAAVVRAKGMSAALAAQRTTLALISPGNGATTKLRARGLMVSFQELSDGTLLVLTVAPGPGQGGTGTHRSSDRGGSWSTIPAPVGAEGLAFATPDEGWAWSADRVYRTRDGGSTWTSESVGSFRMRRGNASGRPVLDRSGGLWVPMNKASDPWELPEPPIAALLEFRPGLPTVRRAEWQRETIEGLAPVGSGDAVVLLRSLDAAGIRVERVPAPGSGHSAETAWSRSGASGRLSARASVAVVEVVEHHEPTSWPKLVVTSADAGRTWTLRDVTDEQMTDLCAVEDGFWMLSEPRRRVTFHPVPRVEEGAGPAGRRNLGPR